MTAPDRSSLLGPGQAGPGQEGPAPGYTGPSLGRIRNVDAALRKHGEPVNAYCQAMLWADPLADRFAADCVGLGRARGMRMFAEALSGRTPAPAIPDVPDSLRELFAHLEAVPDWVDLDQVDRGAAAFSVNAREAGLVLGTSSLVAGYHDAAATRPLVLTGRFGPKLARLRAYETSNWTFATARPGGLRRDGAGFARTARVRMVHAFVRRRILADPRWDTQDLGVPINQADLAFTAVEFAMLPLRAMRRLGIHFSPADVEAMYAMWRYMGYLIGIDERVLITGDRDALVLEDIRRMTSPPPDDDCRAYVHALLDDVLPTDLRKASGVLGLVARVQGREFVHGLSRAFVGDEVADDLGVERNLWRHAPAVAAPLTNLRSRAVSGSATLARWQMRRSLAEVDRVLAQTARDLGVTHDLVDATEEP